MLFVHGCVLGGNVLVGNDTGVIVEKARELFASEGLKSRLKRLPNPFGDGKASGKIIDALKGCCG